MRRLNRENFTKHEEVAKWYDNKFTEMGGSWFVPPAEIDEMLDMLGCDENHKLARLGHLLDLGCGDGKVMARAWERGHNVAGVDISPVACRMSAARMRALECIAKGGEHAQPYDEDYKDHLDDCLDDTRRDGTGWYVHEGPMELLPPDMHIDWAFSYGSMEHALDIPAALKSVQRALMPDGKFLNYAPNEKWLHEDQPLETTMTAAEWMALYDDAGLQMISVNERGDNTIYIARVA